MKFQPGDRVVYTKQPDLDFDHDYGKRATVVKRMHHDEGVVIEFDGEGYESSWYYDRRFVLESVYDSPLYQSLL